MDAHPEGPPMKRLLLVVLCVGCTIRGIALIGDGGPGPGPDATGGTGGSGTGGTGGSGATGGTGGSPLDGGTDACPGVTEECNGRDDDCDGVIDNGFDLTSDRDNCGACN